MNPELTIVIERYCEKYPHDAYEFRSVMQFTEMWMNEWHMSVRGVLLQIRPMLSEYHVTFSKDNRFHSGWKAIADEFMNDVRIALITATA